MDKSESPEGFFILAEAIVSCGNYFFPILSKERPFLRIHGPTTKTNSQHLLLCYTLTPPPVTISYPHESSERAFALRQICDAHSTMKNSETFKTLLTLGQTGLPVYLYLSAESRVLVRKQVF